MSNQILEIEPRDLKFIFELKKLSSCSVWVVNKTDFLVAYKVKTTSPKKYCVRPNVGIVKPKSACEFLVTMQAQKVAPPDLICKDKFLVQSTIVPDGTTDEDITSSMFVKDDGKHVEDIKLRVILLSPPNSPELSPKEEVHNQIPAHKATLPDDHVFNGIDITSQQKEKNLEDINLHKSHIIEEITSPSQTNTGVVDIITEVTIQNFKDSGDINVSPEEITEEIGLQNQITNEEMNSLKNTSIGDINTQKYNIIKEITPSTKHESEDNDLQEHRTSENINGRKNDTTEDISLHTESTLSGIIPPAEHNTENIIPDTKAASIATESVLRNSVAESVATEFEMKKDVTDLNLVKDIECMKSKLDGLESKLREAEIIISKLTEERRLSSEERESLRKEVFQAEIIISKLTEERRLSSEERESLRKEVVSLKGRTFVRQRVQVGFPFLYVVVVAFISMVLGYRLCC